MKKTLLLGCGVSREKRMGVEGDHDWGHLVTADIDPSTGCDVVCDLNDDSLPFSDAEFDEIYAFEVLEHIGKQGDWRGFFDQFGEYHRILKDDGRMFISVPSTHSPWALGDPGHTRVLPIECFYFLSQDHYEQVGRTACTDYRPWWKGDFQVAAHEDDAMQLRLVLKKVPHG